MEFIKYTVKNSEELIYKTLLYLTFYSSSVILYLTFDISLSPDFEKYYKYFSDLKLLDYKVRILNTATGATTRVSIESTDKSGKSWFTIGVSQNIIEASFSALIDSLEYKLFKEKAPANLNVE